MDTSPTISYRPDLPDWGVYLRWPTAGEDWIHPDDRAISKNLIPSQRILRRSDWDGTYYHLHYGPHTLRLKPSMWVQLPGVGLDLEVGQQVELLFRCGQNDPGIYRIADILYSPSTQVIEYYLQSDLLRLEQKFGRADLRPLEVHYTLRASDTEHPQPTAQIPPDVELLDVGPLTEPDT